MVSLNYHIFTIFCFGIWYKNMDIFYHIWTISWHNIWCCAGSVDIFTHIIVHLDRSSLKSLCLTSQDLVPICRSLLFQALRFNLPSYQNQWFKVLQKFAALLAQSPHLATYVRHLQYSFAGIDSTESQLALTVLKALDRIETLTLANSSHLEALLIPDDLALLVLEIMRSRV